MSGVTHLAKRKPTKKQAKAKIPRLPTVPPVAVPLLGPLAPGYVLGKSVEIVADALIDADPLNRTAPEASVARLASVVNDPAIVIDDAMMAVINEPSMAMANNGEVMMRMSQPRSRQFDRANLVRTKPKRKGKKNPKLAAAFKEANARYRTKSGKLRKGRTQADIARLAQRLRRKM